jgi:hypothetical protein
VTTVTKGAEIDVSVDGAGENEGGEAPGNDDDEEEFAAPDEPPAAADNCAKPIEGGFERSTVYTFFYNIPIGASQPSADPFQGIRSGVRTRNVSPTIQFGLPPPPALDATPRSNIPPTHCSPLLPGVPLSDVPRFISAVLIAQDFPPNESETCTCVAQASQQSCVSGDASKGKEIPYENCSILACHHPWAVNQVLRPRYFERRTTDLR